MNTIFRADNLKIHNKYLAAVKGLESNTKLPFDVEGKQQDMPILIEGGGYPGVWLECGPLEGLVYGSLYDMEVARANHNIFFKFQREDGYIPCWFINGKIGTGQIQMVVPVAQTAYEVYQKTKETVFLENAYTACSRWDKWLSQYRDPRGLNLCELFCEYDTGHDNSNRFYKLCKGSFHTCPEKDARICHNAGTLPWLAPDLSATLYGGRVALSDMASVMGRCDEAEYWLEKAEATRRAILAYLYDPESQCFYDLDCNNRFMRIVSDALLRVLCEHVVDQPLFEQIFKRHITSPYGFWTPYPMPSVAVSDPLFDQNPPPNSWGGPSQSLTALRAPRWFEYYNKPAELTHMMKQWMKALLKSDDFSQEMDPWSGKFRNGKNYSPNMCVLLDYTARLYGVKVEEEQIQWNCRLPEDTDFSGYETESSNGKVLLENTKDNSVISIAGEPKYMVKGICRIVTDNSGRIRYAVGTESEDQLVSVKRLYDKNTVSILLKPNEKAEINLFD